MADCPGNYAGDYRHRSSRAAAGSHHGKNFADDEDNFIADEQNSIDDTIAFIELREQLGEVSDTLTACEKSVLMLRFGLYDGRERTLEEVGKFFGATERTDCRPPRRFSTFGTKRTSLRSFGKFWTRRPKNFPVRIYRVRSKAIIRDVTQVQIISDTAGTTTSSTRAEKFRGRATCFTCRLKLWATATVSNNLSAKLRHPTAQTSDGSPVRCCDFHGDGNLSRTPEQGRQTRRLRKISVRRETRHACHEGFRHGYRRHQNRSALRRAGLQICQNFAPTECLPDAENFSYLFDTDDDTKSVDKVKPALLTVQKDFELQTGFAPIRMRPRPLYSKGFFKPNAATKKFLVQNCGNCVDSTAAAEIFSVNLKTIWEKISPTAPFRNSSA